MRNAPATNHESAKDQRHFTIDIAPPAIQRVLKQLLALPERDGVGRILHGDQVSLLQSAGLSLNVLVPPSINRDGDTICDGVYSPTQKDRLIIQDWLKTWAAA